MKDLLGIFALVLVVVVTTFFALCAFLIVIYYIFLVPAIAFIQIGILGMPLTDFITHYLIP